MVSDHTQRRLPSTLHQGSRALDVVIRRCQMEERPFVGVMVGIRLVPSSLRAIVVSIAATFTPTHLDRQFRCCQGLAVGIRPVVIASEMGMIGV